MAARAWVHRWSRRLLSRANASAMLLALSFCTWASALHAEESLPPLTGFVHRSWTARAGAPGQISDFAQTSDGMLWIASMGGLYRFDGVRFVEFSGSHGGKLSPSSVYSLYAPPTGGLWIGLRFGGFIFLKEDHATEYPPDDVIPDTTVTAVVQDRSGVLWGATAAGLLRFQGGHWQRVGETWGLPPGRVVTVFSDRRGTVWTFARDGLYAFNSGAAQFIKEAVALPGAPYPVQHGTLTDSPEGTLWVADLRKGSHPTKTGRTVVLPESTTAQFDRDGALWFSTGDDLRRLKNPRAYAEGVAAPVIERFGRNDGLLGDVGVFFTDRDGNFWVGSGEGVDLFVPTDLRIVRAIPGGFAVARAADGSMWWAETDFDETHWRLHSYDHDHDREVLRVDDALTCAYNDPQGTLWFGGRKNVWRFDGKGLIPLPISTSMPGFATQALVRAPDGALWGSMVRAGVYRYTDGQWQRNGGLTGLPQDAPFVMTADAAGRLWFGYTNNRVALVHGNAVRMLGPADGLNVGNVTAIEAHGDHVWVGGERGLLRFDQGHFLRVQVQGEDPYRSLWGILETQAGELWAAGGRSLIRLNQMQLAEVIAKRVPQSPPQIFDYRDGVIGLVQTVRPLPALREGGDGRVWFALTNGLGFLDPAHLAHHEPPPPVSIQSVSAGGQDYSPFLSDIVLPKLTTQLRLGYSAASFAAPERIRFRYRLEGVDKDWQSVGEQREAVYTNLGPGAYRFTLEAANRDSPWSEPAASLQLSIPPGFYQTRWFDAFCGFIAAGLLWLLYRLRLHQAKRAVRLRLEERIVERERMARDLHDTLLQGLQGLILRFQAVAARIPRHEPARDMIEQALTRADDVLVESRQRVRDIRASTEMRGDLADALGSFGAPQAKELGIEFSVAVEGRPRDLHPVIREEAFMIGREALFNAFRHSRAQRVEVEMSFDPSELRLRIRDDGCGVEPELLSTGGRQGHWGLRGMRERAKKIRSQLEIWSRPDAGMEVALRIPAALAYTRSARITESQEP